MTKRLQKERIEIWYNTEVKQIRGNNRVEAALVMNNKTAKQKEIAIDWVIICVGTEPDTKLAQEAGIEMEGKFVKVDSQMRTNKEGIFACGEITPGPRHLITSASEGASAGMAASEYLALEMVKRGEIFEGARNGKYADEFLAMLG
jgi:thioredoxin reductase (NADPH)